MTRAAHSLERMGGRGRGPVRRGRDRWRGLAVLLMAAALAACSPTPPNTTPDGAVREFIERMGSFRGKVSDAEALFEMLSERAQKNLEDRAQRYSAASGKTIAPSAMLAPGRLVPRFEPQGFGAKVVGKYALVEVRGARPRDKAEIPCVFEREGWRVDLVLPELAPMRMRR